jgi:hypothetical protein
MYFSFVEVDVLISSPSRGERDSKKQMGSLVLAPLNCAVISTLARFVVTVGCTTMSSAVQANLPSPKPSFSLAVLVVQMAILLLVQCLVDQLT